MLTRVLFTFQDVRKCADYFDAMENFQMEKEWLTVRLPLNPSLR